MTRKIYKAYCTELPFIDVPPIAKDYPRAPTATDTEFSIGFPWVYKPTVDTATTYAFGGIDSSGDAIWVLQGPGASDVDTLTGDGGGAIAPTAGTIILAGGTNITTAGTAGPGTITFNLDAAITLATSVTSPIYTSAAAMDINAAAGSNITIQMGDAVGANVIDFEDSASATVATLDSDGTLTVVNMDGIIGATTPAAGTFTTVAGNTSVSSILFTSIGATDTIVEAVLGEDVILRLGDNAGANFLRVQDSDDADLITIDSDGAVSVLAGLTIAGAFAQTAGTFDVQQDNAADACNIAGGNVARAVGIANSAAAHTITLGSVTGACSLDLLAGTGNFTLEGNVATTYQISNTGANTGQIDVFGGTGARTVNIAGGGTGIKTINIGAAATADVISIGDATGAGSLALITGTGGFSLQSEGTSDITVTTAGTDFDIDCVGGAINIASNQAENDAITIEASAANGGIQILAGTGGIRIGDEVDCAGITIGNIAPTQDRVIVIGSGTVVTAAVTDAISIAGDGATTNANSIKTLNLNTGGVAIGEVNTYIATGAVTSGTHLTEIATGNRAAGTMTLDMFTGTGTKVASLGNADAGTTLNIDAITLFNDDVNAAFSVNTGTSTGAITLGAIANSGAMIIESSLTMDLDAAGILSLNSTTAAINIGNDDIDQAVNVGTDGERTVTVGSVNGAAGLVLQAGTEDITVTGTVQDMTANFVRLTGEAVTFTQSPLTGSAADTGVAATGATGDLNLLSFQDGIIMEQFILGAGQTIIKPVMTATGLLISGDEVTTEGYEYNWGAVRANSKHSFTIGTSAAFYLEWEFRADDISGLEPCYCGFRITQANQAVGNIANYTDFVAYGPNDGIAPGDAAISTQLNTGGLVNTDTNDAWANGATHTLRINVSAGGVVTFLFDGAPPTATQAYTFDNGDVVHPFFRHEFNAVLPDAIEWISMDCGFQA